MSIFELSVSTLHNKTARVTPPEWRGFLADLTHARYAHAFISEGNIIVQKGMNDKSIISLFPVNIQRIVCYILNTIQTEQRGFL